MMFLIPFFVFGLVLSSSMAQDEELAMRCGFLYYLPCYKPQMDRPGSFLGFGGAAPEGEIVQRLRDYPYNPPTYTERKSHAKSFRPRMPLLRY